MPHYNTLYGHLLNQLPGHEFEKLVSKYGSDRYTKKLTTWNQLQVLLYAQCCGQQSLRDIESGFLSQASKLYHLGLPEKICRNTLSHANSKRDWRIYHEFFYKLLARCKDLTPKHRFRFKNPLYSFDATTLSLCWSIFPWAKIKHKKGAIKMHFQYDYSGDIPVFMVVSKGDKADIDIAKRHFRLSRDSIYCFDRGYIDYKWFRRIDEKGAFFVTRLKKRMKYRVVGQHRSFTGKMGIISDEVIELTSKDAQKDYPRWIRLIRYYDKKRDEIFEFITNNLELSGRTIADIYRARWQIEAFFKWIKQNLKIKTFLGTSENAVLTQIWAAMCYFLLLAYLKYQTKYKHSLYYLHRLIRMALFQKLTLIDLLNLTKRRLARVDSDQIQLSFAFG
jgi:hypothetical protein